MLKRQASIGDVLLIADLEIELGRFDFEVKVKIAGFKLTINYR
jgi:hypothetical protein